SLGAFAGPAEEPSVRGLLERERCHSSDLGREQPIRRHSAARTLYLAGAASLAVPIVLWASDPHPRLLVSGWSTRSASMVILMLSPTTTPVPSPGKSQRRPKSLRLTDVVASMPRRMPPAWLNGGGAVTARVTGLVTPCMVRLPVTEYEVALDLRKPLEKKVMRGYFAGSRESAALR